MDCNDNNVKQYKNQPQNCHHSLTLGLNGKGYQTFKTSKQIAHIACKQLLELLLVGVACPAFRNIYLLQIAKHK